MLQQHAHIQYHHHEATHLSCVCSLSSYIRSTHTHHFGYSASDMHSFFFPMPLAVWPFIEVRCRILNFCNDLGPCWRHKGEMGTDKCTRVDLEEIKKWSFTLSHLGIKLGPLDL